MLDYRNMLILAPMVRVGTVPMRLLALRYGADIVYSPELIDKRLMNTTRVENPTLGTVDFVVANNGPVCLRVHPRERDRLVVQIGTAEPALAVKAALKVAQDVAGIDVNCGCPKHFSIQGGMGAALLSDPERLCAILEALVKSVPLPISCKIRILDTVENTLALIHRIEDTGVKAIAVHCRTKQERPQDPGHWDVFQHLVRGLKYPDRTVLIANGDMFTPDDFVQLRAQAGITSFMLARAAYSNPSVFTAAKFALSHSPLTSEPPLPPPPTTTPVPVKSLTRTDRPPTHAEQSAIANAWMHVVPIAQILREYVLLAAETDMPYQNAKYTVMQMFPPLGKNAGTKAGENGKRTAGGGGVVMKRTKRFKRNPGLILSEQSGLGGEDREEEEEEEGGDGDETESVEIGVSGGVGKVFEVTKEHAARVTAAKSMRDICVVFGVEEEYGAIVESRNRVSNSALQDAGAPDSKHDGEFPYVPNPTFIPDGKRVITET
ncbi:hypothetical protein BJ742DRAFT_823686 [Cladochytrium replicatum]|nr:hypothetical protein BJ742DRAFT_823686 [Cladochytrium replicatum]